ncbi:UNVERIFIED_ORG: hypothetical protein GGD58_004855 [Rhizobium pisi]
MDNLAVALPDRDVQSATAPCRLGKASKHRAEIPARDMTQAGTGPDPVVRHAGTLRVGQVIGQRVQQVGLEATLAQQFDETFRNVGAPDTDSPLLKLKCISPATRTGLAPIAEDGVKRIGELYRIEAELRGLDPDARLAGRQERSAALIADMRTWLTHQRARVAGKSPLGEALAYIAKHWDGLCTFLTNGRIEIDTNTVERTIRPIALNRKNALFAGHEAGAKNWATIASLIETCKLNAVDPFAYLTSTLTAIIGGYKQNLIEGLLPWNYPVGEYVPKGFSWS